MNCIHRRFDQPVFDDSKGLEVQRSIRPENDLSYYYNMAKRFPCFTQEEEAVVFDELLEARKIYEGLEEEIKRYPKREILQAKFKEAEQRYALIRNKIVRHCLYNGWKTVNNV